MGDRAARRSLAARRRTANVCDLNENDEIDESLNESLSGRRHSRLLNASYNAIDEPAQTPSQLVDLYQKTVELATQGKINIKNAFSIPLVERLPQVLNVIALDDKENHNLGPNFVKAGSVIDTSAKIYGYRVDALHTETQKLSGNIMTSEEDQHNVKEGEENQMKTDQDQMDDEQGQLKKIMRRPKAKVSSYLVSDLSKITLENEFNFRPLQAPNFCQWRGGVGKDSIYAEMVSSTMYSSSDFALIDGFININNRSDEQENFMETILSQTQTKSIDLSELRDAIKSKENHDHVLGSANLRDFSFNELPSTSFIHTLHESSLGSMNDSVQQFDMNQFDENEPADDEHEPFSQEELVSAAIDDLNEDFSHTNEVFKHALSELSQPNPSSFHLSLGKSQSSQPLTQSNFLSTSFLSTISFADQMPNLLNSKCEQSEYSYFDAAKLKLFAGPNIWKYTNLLHQEPTETSTIQQKQAPITPKKLAALTREVSGGKRQIRVDIFQTNSIDQLMSARSNSNREKRSAGTSQSSILLRGREKNLNQMQLARRLRSLKELTNFFHFPDLNAETLDRINRRFDLTRTEIPRVDEDEFHSIDDDHHDENQPISALDFDFVRPVHYERIEFAKGSSSVNPKILKRQMIDEFTRQKTEVHRTQSSLDTSTSSHQSSSICSNNQLAVEFSILCENLADHGHLSVQTDIASAFYCMLINCNENKLYMKNNFTRDDLFIQEQPFTDSRDLSTLSYSYISHSNLSLAH